MPLFSFTNIPYTPVITALIQHQSFFLSSRHANHQAILMYWDAKKQQGTDSSCATIVLLQNLIVLIFKVEHVVPTLNRIRSNLILLMVGTTFFTLNMWTMWFCRGTIVTQVLSVPCCFFASQYIRIAWWFVGLEKMQLWCWMKVVMTGVHGIFVNENNGMIVVQECKKCLSEIVH